jgi:hypothetical protein
MTAIEKKVNDHSGFKGIKSFFNTQYTFSMHKIFKKL